MSIPVVRTESNLDPRGFSFDFAVSLVREMAWSANGRFLAFLLHKEGLAVLDMETLTAQLVPLDRLWWWLRPTWTREDQIVLTSLMSGVALVTRQHGQWVSQPSTTNGLSVHWAETCDQDEMIGLGRLSEDSELALVTANSQRPFHVSLVAAGANTREKKLYLGENPTWWVPGKSVLVHAYTNEMVSPHIVDLERMDFEPLPLEVTSDLGYCHCFHHTNSAPVLVYCASENLSFPVGNCRQEIHAYHVHKRQRTKLLTMVANLHSPPVTDPKAERLAVIDHEYALHILPMSLDFETSEL